MKMKVIQLLPYLLLLPKFILIEIPQLHSSLNENWNLEGFHQNKERCVIVHSVEITQIYSHFF